MFSCLALLVFIVLIYDLPTNLVLLFTNSNMVNRLEKLQCKFWMGGTGEGFQVVVFTFPYMWILCTFKAAMDKWLWCYGRYIDWENLKSINPRADDTCWYWFRSNYVSLSICTSQLKPDSRDRHFLSFFFFF